MKLLLRRSQRAGALAGGMIFCLDARADLSASEAADVRKYRLGKLVIYNSEASKRALARSEGAEDGSIGGGLKSLAFAALAAMKLNISIDSLQRGHHIECKSLDELLGAEEAIMAACKNLRGYLDTAATFDGREEVIDFSTEQPTLVVQAPALHPLTSTRLPELAAPAPLEAPVSVEAVRYELEDGEAVPVASTRIRGAGAEYATNPSADEGLLGMALAIGAILLVALIFWASLMPHTSG